MRNLWKFIPALLVTFGILCFWLHPFLGILLLMGLCWLFIPAIIVSIYFTIASCRLKDRWQKGLFAWGIFNVLLFGASFVFESSFQSCDAFLMAEHYEKNKKAMEELVKYADQALDDSAYVDLEFEDEEAEIKGLCGILQSIARLTFNSGEIFDVFEYLYTGQTTGMDTQAKSNITGFITIPDTDVKSVQTPNGKVDFVQFIGVTDNELIKLKDKEIAVAELYEKLGSDLTDYSRESVL